MDGEIDLRSHGIVWPGVNPSATTSAPATILSRTARKQRSLTKSDAQHAFKSIKEVIYIYVQKYKRTYVPIYVQIHGT